VHVLVAHGTQFARLPDMVHDAVLAKEMTTIRYNGVLELFTTKVTSKWQTILSSYSFRGALAGSQSAPSRERVGRLDGLFLRLCAVEAEAVDADVDVLERFRASERSSLVAAVSPPLVPATLTACSSVSLRRRPSFTLRLGFRNMIASNEAR